jgi:hypothetical protein
MGFRFSPDIGEKLKKPKAVPTSQVLTSPLEYWRYFSGGSRGGYGLLNFAAWLFVRLKHNREAMADLGLCMLLSECRKALKNLVQLSEHAEADCQEKGYPDDLSKLEFLQLRQASTQLLWMIPIEKIELLLNASKKVKEDTEEGFFDYQQLSENSEDSFQNQENNSNFVSIACKNPGAKGEFRSKFELDHLVKHFRNFMVTNRVSFERIVDVVCLKAASNFNSELKKVLNLDEHDPTLDSILSHLRKIDLRKGEENEDSSQTTKAEFLKDMILFEKEVFTFKLRETTIIFPSKLQKNFEKVWITKSRTINYLDKAKVTSKIIEGYQQMLKEFHRMMFEKAELNKRILPLIIFFKERLMMYDRREDIVKFIKHLELVFIKSNRRADLVKVFNVILEKSLPKSEAEDKDDESLKAFRWLQHVLKDAEVTSLSLSLIKNSMRIAEVAEACKLTSNLLKFGNHEVQENLFNTFSQGYFTKEYFQYIRTQFGAILYSKLSGNDQDRERLAEIEGEKGVLNNKPLDNHCEILSNILMMLKLECDNCYLEFQNYLRLQQVAGLKDNPTSIDLVTVVADFLPSVYKLYMTTKQPSLEPLLKAVVNTLTEFVLGPCRDNQRMLIEHKKTIETINAILNIELSLGNANSYNESLSFKVDLLSEAVIFIESLIVGNDDSDSLDSLLDALNKDGLVNKLIEIYMCKVKGKKSELILDIFCHIVFEGEDTGAEGDQQPRGSQRELGCTDYHCHEGYRTKLDKLLVETAFKIFLIMQQLEDKIGGNPAIEGFRYHPVPSLSRNALIEEILFGQPKSAGSNTNDLAVSAGNVKAFILDNTGSDEYKKIGVRQFLMTKISFFGKFPHKFKKKDRKLVSEHLKDSTESEKHKVLSQEEVAKLQMEDIDPEFLDDYKRVLFNEARQFFLSYVASVEVLHKEEIIKVHFTIPYFCRYITRRIEEDVIWNTDRSSDQERLQMFLSNVDKYEFQMKRRQAISSRKWLFFFILRWRMIRVLTYLIVAALNIVILISMTHSFISIADSENHSSYTIVEIYNNFSTKIKTDFQIPMIILEGLQLFLSLMNFILILYENAPEMIFNKLTEKVKESNIKTQHVKFLSSNKLSEPVIFNPKEISFMRKVGILIRNWSNQYNFMLVVLSVIALSGYKLLYSLLLLDLITHSRNLSRTVASFVRNYRLILLSALLIVLLVYFLSVIGFKYFPYIFNRVR